MHRDLRLEQHFFPRPAAQFHQARLSGKQPARGCRESQQHTVAASDGDQFAIRVEGFVRGYIGIEAAHFRTIVRCFDCGYLHQADLRIGGDEAGINVLALAIDSRSTLGMVTSPPTLTMPDSSNTERTVFDWLTRHWVNRAAYQRGYLTARQRTVATDNI